MEDATRRRNVAKRIREFLKENELVTGNAFLSHDEHTRHIIAYMLEQCEEIWIDRDISLQTRFTVVVYERFQNRRVQDVSGEAFILPDLPTVDIPPTIDSDNEELLHLYCRTHLDGTGWHYEWLTARSQPQSTARSSNS